ncbi:MAG: hypothetical protein HQ567_17580 [Candidatus Nealsonbacteria bacterium]|nr:hypothetical protein [Candidatus Nealsonbacteria bacterium]
MIIHVDMDAFYASVEERGGEQAIELFNVSPALFVENQGQWADESVRFMHQGDGVNVAMTDTGPVFQLFRNEPVEDADAGDELCDSFDPFDDIHRPADVVTEVTQFSARLGRLSPYV